MIYLLMMGLVTPETCRGWRNILRISCASSWFFLTRLYGDERSTKHKTFKKTFIGDMSSVEIIKVFPVPKKRKREQFFPPTLCLCKLPRCPNIRSLHVVAIWCIVCLVCRLASKNTHPRKIQIVYWESDSILNETARIIYFESFDTHLVGRV